MGGHPPEWGRPTPLSGVGIRGDTVLGFMWGTNQSPFPLTDRPDRVGPATTEKDKMDQLGNYAGPAKQVATLAHEHVAVLGLEPVPTMILFVTVALFGMVALIVRGGTRRPRGAHRA